MQHTGNCSFRFYSTTLNFLFQERKAILSPDGDKDKDPLLINILEEGQDIVNNLRQLHLHPQPCYRDVEPINLYHKVGHGTLDMYILSPTKDSKEVKEFLQKWNTNDQRLFANQKYGKEFSFPTQNLVSICALLVWQPANINDSITRILFPGSTPQNKIFEGLDKLKQLESIKYPMCTAKTLMPTITKTKQSKTDRILQDQKETKTKEKILHQTEGKGKLENKIAEENIKNVQSNGITTDQLITEKIMKKHDSTESDKSGPPLSDVKKMENGNGKDYSITNGKTEDKSNVKIKPKVEQKSKIEPKTVKQSRTIDKKPKPLVEKKASPTTPKKVIEAKVNGDGPPKARSTIKTSPSATPAKSTKEANNRKVVESKYKAAPKREVLKVDKKDVKPERKPISRRPKGTSPLGKALESPVKKLTDIHKIDSRKPRLEKEGTTDSSTVSTPTADVESALKKDISKLTPEELEQMKERELAELKEEQEVVKEIEAVFRKSELKTDDNADLRKVKNISMDDKTEGEAEEYLIIEKEEIEHDSLDDKDAKESETQKHLRDSEESEKQRKLSDDCIKASDLPKEEIIEEIPKPTEIESLAPVEVKPKEEKETVREVSKEISATSLDDKIEVSSGKKLTDREVDEDNKDNNVLESQPDEKHSTPIESGATTAPTLPEDERITLDEIKEDNGDQPIEEKYVKEDTKEREIPVVHLPPKTTDMIPKIPTVVGIRLDKQTPIRDLVKTPDEVADLPVHEEVDIENYEQYHATQTTTPKQEDPKQIIEIKSEEIEEETPVKIEKETPVKIEKETPVEIEEKIEQPIEKLESAAPPQKVDLNSDLDKPSQINKSVEIKPDTEKIELKEEKTMHTEEIKLETQIIPIIDEKPMISKPEDKKEATPDKEDEKDEKLELNEVEIKPKEHDIKETAPKDPQIKENAVATITSDKLIEELPETSEKPKATETKVEDIVEIKPEEVPSKEMLETEVKETKPKEDEPSVEKIEQIEISRIPSPIPDIVEEKSTQSTEPEKKLITKAEDIDEKATDSEKPELTQTVESTVTVDDVCTIKTETKTHKEADKSEEEKLEKEIASSKTPESKENGTSFTDLEEVKITEESETVIESVTVSIEKTKKPVQAEIPQESQVIKDTVETEDNEKVDVNDTTKAIIETVDKDDNIIVTKTIEIEKTEVVIVSESTKDKEEKLPEDSHNEEEVPKDNEISKLEHVSQDKEVLEAEDKIDEKEQDTTETNKEKAEELEDLVDHIVEDVENIKLTSVLDTKAVEEAVDKTFEDAEKLLEKVHSLTDSIIKDAEQTVEAVEGQTDIVLALEEKGTEDTKDVEKLSTDKAASSTDDINLTEVEINHKKSSDKKVDVVDKKEDPSSEPKEVVTDNKLKDEELEEHTTEPATAVVEVVQVSVTEVPVLQATPELKEEKKDESKEDLGITEKVDATVSKYIKDKVEEVKEPTKDLKTSEIVLSDIEHPIQDEIKSLEITELKERVDVSVEKPSSIVNDTIDKIPSEILDDVKDEKPKPHIPEKAIVDQEKDIDTTEIKQDLEIPKIEKSEITITIEKTVDKLLDDKFDDETGKQGEKDSKVADDKTVLKSLQESHVEPSNLDKIIDEPKGTLDNHIEQSEEDIKPVKQSTLDAQLSKSEIDVVDKIELGRKSPKEREQDVAKIVASVAEVLKSDAPLEEFEGKIPLEITSFGSFEPFTQELRETHITTVESPIRDEIITDKLHMHPIEEEKLSPMDPTTLFLDEERKTASVQSTNENVQKDTSRVSSLIKDSTELMQATSKIISGIKQSSKIDDEIAKTETLPIQSEQGLDNVETVKSVLEESSEVKTLDVNELEQEVTVSKTTSDKSPIVSRKSSFDLKEGIKDSFDAVESILSATVKTTGAVILDSFDKIASVNKLKSGSSSPEPKEVTFDETSTRKLSTEIKHIVDLEETVCSKPEAASICKMVDDKSEEIKEIPSDAKSLMSEMEECKITTDTKKSVPLATEVKSDIKFLEAEKIDSIKDLKESQKSEKELPETKESDTEIQTEVLPNKQHLTSDSIQKSVAEIKEPIDVKKVTPISSGRASPEVKTDDPLSKPVDSSRKSSLDIKDIDKSTSGKTTPEIKESDEHSSAEIETSGKISPILKDTKQEKDCVLSGKTSPDIPKPDELHQHVDVIRKSSLIKEEPLDEKKPSVESDVIKIADVLEKPVEQKLTTLEEFVLEKQDVKQALDEKPIVEHKVSSNEITIKLLKSEKDEKESKEHDDLSKTTDFLTLKTEPDTYVPEILKEDKILSNVVEKTTDVIKSVILSTEKEVKETIEQTSTDLKNVISSSGKTVTETVEKTTPDLKASEIVDDIKPTADLTKIVDLSGKLSPEPKELIEPKKASPVSSGKSTPEIPHDYKLVSKSLESGKSTPDIKELDAKKITSNSGRSSPEIKDSCTLPSILHRDSLDTVKSTPTVSGKVTPEIIEPPTMSGKSTPEIKEPEIEKSPVISGKSSPDFISKDILVTDKSSVGLGKSTPTKDILEPKKSPVLSGKSTPDIVIDDDEGITISGRSTPDTEKPFKLIENEKTLGDSKTTIKDDILDNTDLIQSKEIKDNVKSEISDIKQVSVSETVKSSEDNKITEIKEEIIIETLAKTSSDSGKSSPLISSTFETIETVTTIKTTNDGDSKTIGETIIIKKETSYPEGKDSEKLVSEEDSKIDVSTTEPIKRDSIAGPSNIIETTSSGTTKSPTEELELSRKSTPDIADVEQEKTVSGKTTPPTVPVSPIVKEKHANLHDQEKYSDLSNSKTPEVRSLTPASDDCDISSGQVSRVLTTEDDEKRSYSDDDDIPGSPLSATSQIAHSTSSQYDLDDSMRGAVKIDPMSMSFYGALPDDPVDLSKSSKTVADEGDIDFNKALLEHRQTRGTDLVTSGSPSHVYEMTTAKYSSGMLKEESNEQKIDKPIEDVMTSSFIGSELPKDSKDDKTASWGKPLGLPSPAPLNDNKGTPKKERKIPPNVMTKNKLNEDKKLLDKRGKKINPIYVDLTYVPHHGNSNYSYIEFFKRVRARYYVFSGIEPSKEVYSALLEAKQTWDDKDLGKLIGMNE